MYGWMNQLVEFMIVEKYGVNSWEKILNADTVEFPNGGWGRLDYYDDEVTYALIESAEKVLNISKRDLLEEFGGFFVERLPSFGYLSLLKMQGQTLLDFLDNTNQLHTILATNLSCMRPPKLYLVATGKATEVLVLYTSARRDFVAFFIGNIKKCAESLFDIKVTINEIAEHPDILRGKANAALLVRLKEGCPAKFGTVPEEATRRFSKEIPLSEFPMQCPFTGKIFQDSACEALGKSEITLNFTCTMLSHCLLLKLDGQKFIVEQAGPFFYSVFPGIRWGDDKINVQALFKTQAAEEDSFWIRELASSTRRTQKSAIVQASELLHNAGRANVKEAVVSPIFTVRLVIVDAHTCLLLVSPSVYTAQSLDSMGLSLEDLPSFDFSRDLMVTSSQLEVEMERNHNLKSSATDVETKQTAEIRVRIDKDKAFEMRMSILTAVLWSIMEISDTVSDWFALVSLLQYPNSLVPGFAIFTLLGTMMCIVSLHSRMKDSLPIIMDLKKNRVKAIVPRALIAERDLNGNLFDVSVSFELIRLISKRKVAQIELLTGMVEDGPVLILSLISVATQPTIPWSLQISLIFSAACFGLRLAGLRHYFELQHQINHRQNQIDGVAMRINRLHGEFNQKRLSQSRRFSIKTYSG